MSSLHRRFDDDDDDENENQLQDTLAAFEAGAMSKHVDLSDSDDSDNEHDSDSDAAPEAVSTSAAIAASEDARKRVAESLRITDELVKAKRQKLEAKLVKQTRKRRKVQAAATAAATATEEEEEAKGQSTGPEREDRKDDGSDGDDGKREAEEATADGMAPLPIEVIRAAEQERLKRLAARSRPSATEKAPKKRKIVDADPRPVKDVRVGGTVIRVLRTESSTLPPRATAPKQNAREAWLAGRTAKTTSGAKSGLASGSRKPWKKGFLVNR